MNLTEDEQKYLLKFEKSVEKIYWNYISLGLLLCVAMVGLIIAIVKKRNEGFLIAIISGGIGLNLFLLSRSYQKLYAIIKKMKQYISELTEIKKGAK